jgi:hypothetical protein
VPVCAEAAGSTRAAAGADRRRGGWRLEIAGDFAKAAQPWTNLGCPYEAALALPGAREKPAMRDALGIFIDLGQRCLAGHPVGSEKLRVHRCFFKDVDAADAPAAAAGAPRSRRARYRMGGSS